MFNENEIYKKVARECSSYEPTAESEFTNSCSDESSISCKTCTHFTKDEHCILDLYDKIVENI